MSRARNECMPKLLPLISILIILGGAALAACGGDGERPQTNAGGEQAVLVERLEPPPDYADRSNPYTGDNEATAKGEVFYQANCAACHGNSGRGDGPASASLDPRPQNLAQYQQGMSDAYLYWRIAEGGLMKPFTSLMPGWKSIMTEEQIWQVITYLRQFDG